MLFNRQWKAPKYQREVINRMKKLNKVLEGRSRREMRTLGKKEAAVYRSYHAVHHQNGQPWIVGAVLPGPTEYKDVGGISKMFRPGIKERRADLIHKENGILKVVEFKVHIDHQAVGQVLLYGALIERNWRPESEIRLIIAGREIENDVAELCKKLDIEYELYSTEDF